MLKRKSRQTLFCRSVGSGLVMISAGYTLNVSVGWKECCQLEQSQGIYG
ncbi:MAG: hypothetical protein IJ839_03355 [Ruminobacter sp.]|nr:hypothetical protein [Ruminobacter sp.]